MAGITILIKHMADPKRLTKSWCKNLKMTELGRMFQGKISDLEFDGKHYTDLHSNQQEFIRFKKEVLEDFIKEYGSMIESAYSRGQTSYVENYFVKYLKEKGKLGLKPLLREKYGPLFKSKNFEIEKALDTAFGGMNEVAAKKMRANPSGNFAQKVSTAHTIKDRQARIDDKRSKMYGLKGSNTDFVGDFGIKRSPYSGYKPGGSAHAGGEGDGGSASINDPLAKKKFNNSPVNPANAKPIFGGTTTKLRPTGPSLKL